MVISLLFPEIQQVLALALRQVEHGHTPMFFQLQEHIHISVTHMHLL
jgi:hypothetical protein